MNSHTIQVKSIENATHNVLKIVAEKPPKYNFVSGQATKVAINKPGWEDEKRPFTFTSLPEDDYLEFVIKVYPTHQSVTNELLNLKEGEELIIENAWGAINYQGEGTFIAGGAGITPFVSILRNLYAQNKLGNNKLIFANDLETDIIYKEEFEKILGDNFINILSQQKTDKYAYGHLTETFLKKNIPDLGKFVYLCGPPSMMETVERQLANLKVSSELIIKEK